VLDGWNFDVQLEKMAGLWNFYIREKKIKKREIEREERNSI
jgi:hypothetical protein